VRYKSFMLRVWQRQEVNGVEWAGSLESIQAPGEWRFRTLEQLLTQLLTQLQSGSGAAASHELPGGTPRPDQERATQEEAGFDR
jgi:hypothetical protein